MRLEERLMGELDEAEMKAWDALGRYKFQMFGYWAAIWVHLNRLSNGRRQNPWRCLVQSARGARREGAVTDIKKACPLQGPVGDGEEEV